MTKKISWCICIAILGSFSIPVEAMLGGSQKAGPRICVTEPVYQPTWGQRCCGFFSFNKKNEEARRQEWMVEEVKSVWQNLFISFFRFVCEESLREEEGKNYPKEVKEDVHILGWLDEDLGSYIGAYCQQEGLSDLTSAAEAFVTAYPHLFFHSDMSYQEGQPQDDDELRVDLIQFYKASIDQGAEAWGLPALVTFLHFHEKMLIEGKKRHQNQMTFSENNFSPHRNDGRVPNDGKTLSQENKKERSQELSSEIKSSEIYCLKDPDLNRNVYGSSEYQVYSSSEYKAPSEIERKSSGGNSITCHPDHADIMKRLYEFAQNENSEIKGGGGSSANGDSSGFWGAPNRTWNGGEVPSEVLYITPPQKGAGEKHKESDLKESLLKKETYPGEQRENSKWSRDDYF